jgi:hypothetical protein
MAKPTYRSHWTAWVLTLLIPLLSLGCMKAAETSAPGYYDDGYAGDEDYYREAEVAEEYGAPAADMVSRGRSKGGMFEARR